MDQYAGNGQSSNPTTSSVNTSPTSTKSAPPASTTAAGGGGSGGTVAKWGQCGGAGHTGPTVRVSGSSAHLTMSGTRSACKWTEAKAKFLVLSSRHRSRVDVCVGLAKNWRYIWNSSRIHGDSKIVAEDADEDYAVTGAGDLEDNTR